MILPCISLRRSLSRLLKYRSVYPCGFMLACGKATLKNSPCRLLSKISCLHELLWLYYRVFYLHKLRVGTFTPSYPWYSVHMQLMLPQFPDRNQMISFPRREYYLYANLGSQVQGCNIASMFVFLLPKL